jgi:tetratricopeptide (TPR) repeat protein
MIRQKNRSLVIFGLVIVIFGLLPIWSTLRQITVGKWSDRFSISAMFGVALVISTLVFWAFNSQKVRSAFLIILVALSISYHIRLGNEYRKDYNRQKAFYTQLSWRIPQLQPGTIVYSPAIPSNKEADYSYSMGINMLYSSQVDGTLDYWFLVPRYVSPESLLRDPSQTIKQGLRIFMFEGSGNKVISIHMPDQGCLWVINPYYALSYPDTMPAYAEFSNESLISDDMPESSTLLESSISLAPQNAWCYYFEKIDLARSQNNWLKAIELYQTTLTKNLRPIEGVEFLPVIQSYVGLGDVEKAVELTNKAIAITPASAAVFCGYWNDIATTNSGINVDQIDSFFNPENCPVELQ